MGMYLYGASGHAKVIIELLENNGMAVDGLFDDDLSRKELCGYPVYAPADVRGPLIVSIGDNRTRCRFARSLRVEFGKAADPSAVVSGRASWDEGSVIMQGAVVQSGARIGKHSIINTGATVDHDCTIHDFVHISPGVTLCGNVNVGEGSWIGAGSVVLPGVKIGQWCVIGAGSVVTGNIPDRSLAYGNPCKIIKKIE